MELLNSINNNDDNDNHDNDDNDNNNNNNNNLTVDTKYLDYIDELFSSSSIYISELILKKKIPITPNMISILSILLTISLVYFIKYKNQYKIGALIFLLTRYLDTLDGILARKGNMESSLGEKLDHYGDILQIIILIYLLIDKRRNKNIYYWIIPIIVLIILSLSMSCQQKWINSSNRKEKNETIKDIELLCPYQIYKNPILMKYFGYGFATLLMSFYIANIGNMKKSTK